MVKKDDGSGYKPVVPGIRRKTIVHGEKTLLAKFKLEKGYTLPAHSHPHEQTGFMAAGKLRFTINGEDFTAESGDCWIIPGNVEHSAEVLEDSFLVEVFSPVREDYKD